MGKELEDCHDLPEITVAVLAINQLNAQNLVL